MVRIKLLNTLQIVILLALFSLLLLLTIYKPLGQDEGVFLTMGKFLHYGVLPYRDVFDHKPPGIYFLNYLILGVSNNLYFIKTLYAFINLASAILIAKIYIRVTDRTKYCYLPSIFFLILIIIFEGNYLIAEVPMILCFLLALNLNQRLIRNYFLIGFFCSLAILFKQTAIISSLIIIIFVVYKNRKDAIQLISGFFLPLFLVLIYLLITQTVNDGMDQIIWRNVCCYPKESFSSIIKYLSFYFWRILPILILVAIGIYFYIKKYQSLQILLPIIMLVILPVPFFFVRHYPHYWIQILPFLAILASFSTEKLISYKSIIIRIIIGISIILMLISNFRLMSWQLIYNYIPKWQEQNQIVRYLKNNNLNQIFTESQFSYFSLYNIQKPPTKYLYISEVNNQNGQAENETIEILKNNKNIVVLWPENPDFAYAKALQQYILEYYDPIKIFQHTGMIIYKAQ